MTARLHSRLRKGVRLLAFGLLGILMATSIFIALGAMTNRYRLLSVLSGSMEPSIPKGALIMSIAYSSEQIRAGDVIIFHSPQIPSVLVTHRVVDVMQPGAYPIVHSKGDANTYPDPWDLQLTDSKAWRAVFTVPYVGYVLAWLREPEIGISLLIGVPLVLIVVGSHPSRRPQLKSHPKGKR